MRRVEGKVCIVTGAASGLGKADAIALAGEGARVVLTDVDEAQGHAAAAEIGGDSLFVRQDVTDEEGWRVLIGSVEERFGRLDVLVNNAGILIFGDIETVTLEDWRKVLSVNLEGTFLGIKHALPAMRRSGGGSIINVSSTAVLQGYTLAPAYVASKGAVVSLTKSVAMHSMRRGDRIRCNVILPHHADTPMMRAVAQAAAVERSSATDPLGLRVGSAAAVAKAVLFLASDESGDLNGTTLNLDRGNSLIAGTL